MAISPSTEYSRLNDHIGSGRVPTPAGAADSGSASASRDTRNRLTSQSKPDPKSRAHLSCSVGRTQGFLYSDLPAPLAEELRARADRIRIGLARHTTEVLQVGSELRAAKERLRHGTFLAWAECEIGISPRAAQLYMRASAWITNRSEKFSHLTLSTLYLLAARNTPPEVTEEFVRRIEKDAPVSYGAVRERIEAVRRAKRKRNYTDDDKRTGSSLGPIAEESLIVTDKEAVKTAVEALVCLLARSSPSDDLERVRQLLLHPDVRALPYCLGRQLIQALSQSVP